MTELGTYDPGTAAWEVERQVLKENPELSPENIVITHDADKNRLVAELREV